MHSAPAPASAECGCARAARLRGRRPSLRPWQSLSACARESWLFPTTSLSPRSKRWLISHELMKLRIAACNPASGSAADAFLSLPACRRRRIYARILQRVARAPALPPTLKLRRPRSAPAPPRALLRRRQNVIDQQNMLRRHSATDRKLKTRRAHSAGAGAASAPPGSPWRAAASACSAPASAAIRDASCAERSSASAASERDWLNPRCAYLDRCSGTGTPAFRRSLAGKLRDRLGQHASEPLGGGVQAIVFEGVNSLAHAALVNAVRNGADKGRGRQAAGAAKH